MLKSISYWSFAGGLEGTKPLKQAFRQAKAAGFEAVEVCVGATGVLRPDSTRADCKQIVADAKAAGVKISGLATGLYWSCSLSNNDPVVRERAKGNTRRMLQIGQWLGVDALLVVPGAVDVFFDPSVTVVPYDAVYARSLVAIKELARDAEKARVAIAIENVWNKFLLSPLEMCDFIESVGSDYVGAYFDVGNVLLFGYPDQWIRILGKRIKRVHLKDFKRSVGTAAGFCDLLAGDVNWPAVMAALREVKYDGPLTAEMMPPDKTLLRRTSKAMDKIMAM